MRGTRSAPANSATAIDGERRREPCDDDAPEGVVGARAVDEEEVGAEAGRGDERERNARCEAAGLAGLLRDEHDTDERERDPDELDAAGRSPRASPTTTGITAADAEIGATTPIAPTAIPR